MTQLAERPPPPPIDRLRLRGIVVDPVSKMKVDAAAGTISGVSLLTANREAAGHGMWIDNRTLETFLAQLSGRPLKAYATHGMWGKDGTLDEVGLWNNPLIDTSGKDPQLREDFGALDSWKKHSVAEFDTLFELAAKAPSEFGASLAFRYTLAWVTKKGAEIETVRKWRSVGMWDYEPYFDPPMPADALREMPSVRAVEVYSADFVDTPAANDGLFSAPVDTAANVKRPLSAMSITPKDLHARFGANPAHLARALALSVANESHTLDQLAATIASEEQESELKKLRAAAETTGTELTSLKAFKQTAEAEEAKLAALGFKAAAGKTVVDAAVAEIATLKADLKQKTDAIAALRGSGALRIATGEGGEGKPDGGASALTGLARTEAALRAEHAAKAPAAKK